LVTDWVRKIISLNICEIVGFGDFVVGDIVGIFKFFAPGLRLSDSLLEIVSIFSELLLWLFDLLFG
jgi:hypothetical protein